MWFLFTNWILPNASYVRYIRFRGIRMRPKIIEYSNERVLWITWFNSNILTVGKLRYKRN